MKIDMMDQLSKYSGDRGEEGEFWDRPDRSQNILIPVELDETNQIFGYYFLDSYKFPHDGQKNLNEIVGSPLKVELAGLNVYVGPIIPKLQDNYVKALFTLADSIDRCDKSDHSHDTGFWAQQLSQHIKLPGLESLKMCLAGRLHDIGKSVVSRDLLTKPGPLTKNEWAAMKQHPAYSAALIEPVHALSVIKPIVRWHHERFNGGGYPDGLSGQDIPIGSRILAIADAYSTMTSGRAYKKPLTTESAVEELIRFRGTQFDPELVDEMVEVVRISKHPTAYSTR
jgi:HD-GYP domain-containing protein (c-di-GMP phosphodiesterase class II)